MELRFIYLIFACAVNLSLCNESAEHSGTKSDNHKDEDKKLAEDDGPGFDHSAFLQIDNTENIHIQNSKKSKLKMRKLIKQIDENKDGKISERELAEWMEKVIDKYVYSEGQKHMPKIDKNKDGHATWDEYTVAAGYTKGDKQESRKSSAKSKQRDKEKFTLADMDYDGRLNFYELGLMIHPNESPIMGNVVTSEFLDSLDSDLDGLLSLSEISGGVAEISEYFKALDKDKNGQLDREELMAWISPEGDNPFVVEAQTLIEEMDRNRDNFITENEIFKYYDKFATSRATVYGRLIRPNNDDELEDEEQDTDDKVKKQEKEEENDDQVKKQEKEKENHDQVKKQEKEEENDDQVKKQEKEEEKLGKMKVEDEL